MQIVRPGVPNLVRAEQLVRELSALPDDEARARVETLPAVDLLLLTKRLPHADALMLVEYASHDQVTRMIDLDAWRGDQLDVGRFFEWTGTLAEVSQEKAVAFLAEADDEYPALTLLKVGRVADHRDVESGEAPFDEETEEALQTPDQQFVVILPREDPMAAPVRALIDFLYAGDLDHARQVLQAARWELPSVVEENLFHVRTGHLEEMGIPTAERAARVFRPLSAGQEERVLSAPALRDVRLASERLTDLLLAPLERHADGALEEAVEGLPDDLRAQFAQAVVYVAHKVAVARGDDPADATALAAAMQVVADHLRLALDVLAPRVEAARAVAVVHPEVLFRVAHTRLVALRQRAHRVLEPLGGEGAVVRLDPPWDDVLHQLLQIVPQFVRPGIARLEVRPFRTVADLDEASALLDVAANHAVFLADVVASAPRSVEPFGHLLATGIANQVLGRGWSYAPLAPADLPALIAALVVTAEGRASIRPEVREALATDFVRYLAASHPDRADDAAFERDLRALVLRTLDHLADALGSGGRDAAETAGVAAAAVLVEGEDGA
jgi:hypothetical protein